MIRERVTAAELLLLRRSHTSPERVDLSRITIERGEENLQGKWRGRTLQSQMKAPCGVCGRHMEDNQRFVLSRWIVHRRCVKESAEGAADRGDDLFGVITTRSIGPSRRRTFHLTETLPRIHLRYGHTTAESAHHQQQLEIRW